MTTLPTPPRNTRAILIQQQDRAPKIELALPTILRNPFLALLWMLVLSTVVATLLLGRIRVPHTAAGIVVTDPSPTATDSLTHVILLPAWSRAFLRPGQTASVDTGGSTRLTVTIASVDPSPLTLNSARRWLDAPNASSATIDTTLVVARLQPCTGPVCPKLATGTRYSATTKLGTRSLASFAIPAT